MAKYTYDLSYTDLALEQLRQYAGPATEYEVRCMPPVVDEDGAESAEVS